MNKIVLTLLMAFAALVISFSMSAQKIAFIDTDYIMDNIPEYKEAQAELDDFSKKWQKEIEEKYAEIDELYRAYQAEQILLTDDMKQKRENEIISKEKQAKDLQRQRFGVEGDLFRKRQELVKPIQDKIYTAIKDYATGRGYNIIFDKSQTNILYGDERYDKSEEVLKMIGRQ
jgi:outer membrane protein